jgi:7-cyano-7-deazaguanine reductase
MGHNPFSVEIPLGKQSEQVSVYTPSLLVAISRQEARTELGLTGDDLPFSGVDIWNSYELSWLDMGGKPEIALAQIDIPCSSASLVESKSLKLYLNSFSQTKFRTRQEVSQTIESDLAITTGSPVLVDLYPIEHANQFSVSGFAGDCLDQLSVEIDTYQPEPAFLAIENEHQTVNESLYSHLLRSVCPVTGQPDWASVQILYAGHPIEREGLLKYIISFREHQGFHEQCIEKMFVEINSYCKPEKLTVYGRFLRRGGIDINPYRTNTVEPPNNIRMVRQ